MTEDQIRNLLHEMRDEPVPADSLARVRVAVAKRTQTAVWMRWKIVALVFVTACAVLVVVWPRTAVPPVPAPVAVVQPAPPAAIIPQSTPPPLRPVVKPARDVKPVPAPDGGVLIRIETPDPDVVILLIGD